MPSTLLDSLIFKDVFGTAAMRAVFDDEATAKAYVRVEVALAVAQGPLGLIPTEHATAIAAEALHVALDFDTLKAEAETVGYPIAGLVRQLSTKLGEAGRSLHWGATTQDVMDTATVLQVRDALALVEADLQAIGVALARLAATHRETPMAGRTHLQQALPITFGHKVAIWLDALMRHQDRLRDLKPRVLRAQLGGAVGTLASMGPKALDVHRAFAAELGLEPAEVPWHAARDGLCEVVQVLALITGTLGKIGFDVMLLMATEVAEAFEPFARHRGASSTMPQKRNPISSEILVANSKAVRQLDGLMLDSLVADHERASGPWQAEWLALPQAFILTSGSLAHARFILDGLVVDAARMRQNLDLTRGLIVAEAVMMGLAPALGRQPAHDLVYAACRKALSDGRTLHEVLAADPAITASVPAADLARLSDPANYLGSASRMVDAVLARWNDRQ
jgi:3-carboxy-cis,cis-muconate cycloisomerase